MSAIWFPRVHPIFCDNFAKKVHGFLGGKTLQSSHQIFHHIIVHNFRKFQGVFLVTEKRNSTPHFFILQFCDLVFLPAPSVLGGSCSSRICLARERKAWSTPCPFFALVSTNGIPAELAASCKKKIKKSSKNWDF